MQHAPPLAPTLAQPGAFRVTILPVVAVLLCTLVALLLLRQRPVALRIPIGDPSDAVYVAGMYAPERGELGDAFRWTTPLAQLRAPGMAFYPAGLLLRAYGDRDPQAPRRPVAVRRGERPLAVLPLEPGWRDYHVLAPGAGWDAWDDPPFMLAADPLPRTPDDGRDKGFPLARFGLLPFERTQFPWSMLSPVALLAVAAAGLWRIDRAVGGHPNWRGRRIAVLICVPALALLVLAVRGPQLLARTLPPLPWTIGLAVLVLLVARPVRPHGTATRITAAVSVLIMLGGLALLSWPRMLPLGGGITALGLLLFPTFEDRPAAWEARLDRRWCSAALGLIFLLALGLRVFRIDELPYGLWRDEGRHGLEALRMLNEAAYRPAYIESVDLPGLGLLPFSWSLGVWGIQPWAMRSITALAGALTVVPLYGLVTQLSGSRPVALLAALLLAASHWSIALSRFSFPTVFDPLLQLTALWLLLYALGNQRALLWRCLALLGAGACLGVAAQTYHTGRIGLLVAGAFALSYWAGNREARRSWPLVLGLLGIGFLLTVFPLLGYALEHPARFSSRLGTVSLLGVQEDWHAPLGMLDRSLGAHLMMWWARGDLNGRHVAPGRPMIDPLTGLGLLIGLALLVRGLGDWRKRCLLLGLLLGLLPSALAVEYPHAMRSVDALGFACAIAALGLVAAGRALTDPASRHGWSPALPFRRPLRALPWLIVGCIVVSFNAWVYFGAMPSDRAVWTAVYPYHTRVGAYLRQRAGEGGAAALRDLYVPAGLLDNAVFEYLAYGLEPRTYQSETPSNAAPGSQFIVLGTLSQADVERLVRLHRLDPASAVAGPMLPDGSRPAFMVYRVGE